MGDSTTALGDWYANRIVVGRKPLLVVVSAKSLLSLVTPARDLRSFPNRVAELVEARLRRLGVRDLIEAEVGAMEPVVVQPTRDRSVLGTLVDFGLSVPYCLRGQFRREADLAMLEDELAHSPCRAGQRDDEVVWPDRDAPALLTKRWGS